MSADAGAVLIRRQHVVGTDRDEPRVTSFHLADTGGPDPRPGADPLDSSLPDSAPESSDPVPEVPTGCDVCRRDRSAHNLEIRRPRQCPLSWDSLSFHDALCSSEL